jgi:hypothetical protein
MVIAGGSALWYLDFFGRVMALVLAFCLALPLVFIAVVLQGVTGGFLGPAIAAISLGLVGHSALAERLGRNQRFGSTGALVGAALMGIAVFLLSCAHQRSAVQALDGISATVLGVLTALIIADLTWRRALLGQYSALGPS